MLLIEHDALSAAMLRAHLEQLGHQVVHAQSGERALDLARVCDLDLVVVDARMPDMDGPAIVAALRRVDGRAAQARVVALTEGCPDEARDCAAAGADTVLRKPVTVPAVARAIAEAQAAQAPANDRSVA